MKQLYANWMNNWENQLCFRSTNRVVRPFEWGLEWTRDWPVAQMHPKNGHSEAEYLKLMNELAIQHSDHFFDYKTPTDFRYDETSRMVRFTSPVASPYPENNIVHGLFPRHAMGAEPADPSVAKPR